MKKITHNKNISLDKNNSPIGSNKQINLGSLTNSLPKTNITTNSVIQQLKTLRQEKEVKTNIKNAKLSQTTLEVKNGSIDENEKIRQDNIIISRYNTDVKLIDEKIKVLDIQNESINKLKNSNKRKSNLQQNRNSRKIKSDKINIREKSKSFISSLVGLGIGSIGLLLSNIIGTRIKSTNSKISKLSVLVDNTNAIINSIETKNDIVNAQTSRNNTLKSLESSEDQLSNTLELVKGISKILLILSIIVKIISVIIKILSATPDPSSISKGTALILYSKINNISNLLIGLSVVINISTQSLENNLEDIKLLKDSLDDISNILDIIITDDLTGEEIALLREQTNETGNIGLVGEYKGFRFYIRIEDTDDPKFIVKGNKRRYAVALDSKDKEIFRSDFSFTLNPDILISQLKTKINKNNSIA